MRRSIDRRLLMALLIPTGVWWCGFRPAGRGWEAWEPARAAAQSPNYGVPFTNPPAQLAPGPAAGAMPMAPAGEVRPVSAEDEDDAGFATAASAPKKPSAPPPVPKPVAATVKGGARLGAPAGARPSALPGTGSLPGRGGALPGSGALPGRAPTAPGTTPTAPALARPAAPPSYPTTGVPEYPVAGSPAPAATPRTDGVAGFDVPPPTAVPPAPTAPPSSQPGASAWPNVATNPNPAAPTAVPPAPDVPRTASRSTGSAAPYTPDLAPPMSYRAKKRTPDGVAGTGTGGTLPDGSAGPDRYPTAGALPTSAFPSTSNPAWNAEPAPSTGPAAARGNYPAQLADDGRASPGGNGQGMAVPVPLPNSGIVRDSAPAGQTAGVPLGPTPAFRAPAAPAPREIADPFARDTGSPAPTSTAAPAASPAAAGGYANPWADAAPANEVAKPASPAASPATASGYANPWADAGPANEVAKPAAPVASPATAGGYADPWADAAPATVAAKPIGSAPAAGGAYANPFDTTPAPATASPGDVSSGPAPTGAETFPVASTSPTQEKPPVGRPGPAVLADTGYAPGSVKRFAGPNKLAEATRPAPIGTLAGSPVENSAGPTDDGLPNYPTASETASPAPVAAVPSGRAERLAVVTMLPAPPGSAAPAGQAVPANSPLPSAEPAPIASAPATESAAPGSAWADRSFPAPAEPSRRTPEPAAERLRMGTAEVARTESVPPTEREYRPEPPPVRPTPPATVRDVPAEQVAYSAERFRPEEAATPTGPAEVLEASVLARVNGDVILAGEILPGVDKRLEGAAGKISAEQRAQLREMLIKQQLEQLIQRKIVFLDAKREIPEKAWPQLETQLNEGFDERLEEIIVESKLNGRAQLDEFFQKQGTTLEAQRKNYHEIMIARQWMQKNGQCNEMISRQELLNWYYDHQKEYEVQAKSRWEELHISFRQIPDREQAWAAIVQLGNRVVAGEPFAEVAKSGSHGVTADKGGARDWTTENSLKAKNLNEVLFTLPVGQLSPITETEQGFHIVRVVERQNAGYTPFRDTQKEIKDKILEQRRKVAQEEYIKKLKANARIWTIFDAETVGPTASPIGVGQAPTNTFR